MKEDADLSVAAPEDGPWRDQLLEAETALGGRFESKEDVDLGVLARVRMDPGWTNFLPAMQRLEADSSLSSYQSRACPPPLLSHQSYPAFVRPWR